MYKCSVSGKVSTPGEKSYKIITKTRKKDYYEDRPDDKGIPRTTKVASGWEIVEEQTVCKEIYEAFNGKKY